ncbi:ABC transporter permease subunit [Thermobifida halotolerans]|uniref:ABC transporter permease subunit n=1 Tax=Thermobifida halotolerans TaxID=483545 RepID=A0AA97LVC0_9ACTN|nr:ABC transporter permease subunit [Thermobifida halotolerans]UOE18759.1 ABC transporter permease subunit [Thermobifida halotolerans]
MSVVLGWLSSVIDWFLPFPPRLPIGEGFEALNEWLKTNFGAVFEGIGAVIDWSVTTLREFLVEPQAAQLTAIAVAVLAVVLVRVHLIPVLVIAATTVALYIGQAAFELGNTIINHSPPQLFLWAMALFGQDGVEANLVIGIVALAALVGVAAVNRTRLATVGVVAGGWLATILCGWLLFGALPEVIGQPTATLMMLLLSALAWAVAGWKLGVFSLVALTVVISIEQWDNAMSTLSLVLVASLIAVVVAIPIGVLAAYSTVVSRIVKPVLDLMQTMPAFVYLIPAIFFFSLGAVPGVVATVIFAMPPGVRLTELGIRQIDRELVEAGEAFGAPTGKILTGIQLPLALSTIMAGVNQVIMLGLSMVVIAGMVGAGGLGNQVYQGISRNDGALGFEGGIAVVILAIFLDRLTAAVTRRSPQARAEHAAAA